MKKNLWGGRFKKGMHPVLQCFSYSLWVDYELLDAEIAVDLAWAKMLGKTGLITRAESSKLVKGLQLVAKELRPAHPHERPSQKLAEFEDIHTLIQTTLEKKIGPTAKKIHTGRSRNDLVVTSTRIYLREKNEEIQKRIRVFQKALVSVAGKAGDLIIPGMTHLKKAQPVLLAHHLLAYVEMLEEDYQRLVDVQKRINVMPLGSAALAGSALPLNQAFLAKELGFSKIASNSMAATSDRAFLTEFVSHLSLLWVHLSRLAEDFILWNSEAFGFIDLDDAFSTGSSLMPQKKNPDVFELIRGRTGVVLGDLVALITLQKGLPLAYNRDLQEDKSALFDAIRKTTLGLEVLALTVESVSLNPAKMQEATADDNLFATDILEYLVRKKVPFTEAHGTVGRAVRLSMESGKPLRDFSLADWKKFSPAFTQDVYDLFDVKTSVTAKKTVGSTNPARVKAEVRKWQKR